MKKLFLTGESGCGKSTAIAHALGEQAVRCGGFFTRRYRQPYLYFTLESPDGSRKETFLDFSDGTPKLYLQVFSRVTLEGNILVLDEIGGMELLDKAFRDRLYEALDRDVPMIGVLKGPGPAGALIEALGLGEAYIRQREALEKRISQMTDTVLYPCGRFDEHARLLAEQWVKENLHG